MTIKESTKIKLLIKKIDKILKSNKLYSCSEDNWDCVVCRFKHLSGGLWWYNLEKESEKNKKYEQNI